jgi:integrase
MAIRKFTKKKQNGEIYYRWGYDFYDDNAVRHRITNCETKTEANNEYKKAISKVAKGELVRENKTLTFQDIVDGFLDLHAEVWCKESTFNWYKRYINKHLIPYFKDYRVVNINTALIKKFIADKKKEERILLINDEKNKNQKKEIIKKYSFETINHCLVILKAIFNKAVENELISKNPAIKIKKLKIEEDKEMHILSPDECSRFLSAAKEYYPDFYPMAYIALFTGMREAEILGITWDVINFANKKIRVNKSVYEGKLVPTVKSSSSFRNVDMTNSLVDVLKTLKKENNTLNKLVFSNNTGNPICVQNMLNRRFHPCIKKAGITNHVRFHDLRHTYVSLLISKNIPMKYIQNQVGHSSITVTMNTYGHLLSDVHENAIQVLDSISSEIREKSLSNAK